MRYIIATVFLLFMYATGGQAQAKVELRDITKEEGVSATRLILHFSEKPSYRLEPSGQRIDLFLSDTDGGSLKNLPEDGKVVRILLGQQERMLMASFLLRAIPKKVKVLTDARDPRLVLELTWDKSRGPSRPAITSKLKSPSQVRGAEAVSKITKGEDFGNQWQTFCLDHEAPLQVPVPVRYSLPPLPRLVFNPIATGEIGDNLLSGLKEWQQGSWSKARDAFEKISYDKLRGVDREAFPLLYGEVLIRVGAGRTAEAVLEAFFQDFPESFLRARAQYLLSYLCAAMGKPYESGYQLSCLLGEVGDAEYYRQLANLLQAEVDLATARYEKALAALGAVVPQGLATVRDRRKADVLVATGKYAEALQLYQALDSSVKAWGAYPHSLSQLAEALYRQQDFSASAKRYAELAEVVESDEEKGLASFGYARGMLRAGQVDEAVAVLKDVAESFSATEGGQRAKLMLLDQEIIAAPGEKGFMQMLAFQQLGITAGTRELREEAAFKHVLLTVLQATDLSAMNALEAFVSQNQNGRFKEYAEALLTDVLPEIIQTLIRNEQYFNALLLVEKHRHLLAGGSVKTDFLVDLGNAFQTMGLMEKAAKVYFFMLDAYQGLPGEEPFYLPLVQVLYEDGKSRLTLEYADRYFERFPNGAQRSLVLALKFRTLFEQRDFEGAAKILTSGGLEPSQTFDLMAGTVFWELNRLDKVEEVLSPALSKPEDRRKHPQLTFYLAEALFQRGKLKQALPLYQELDSEEPMADQASYRRAQIALQSGQKEEALNLFRELAEKGKNTQWKIAAEGAVLAEQSHGL